ncbi:acyltransferase family protein [Flagellimonas olearia]|uniref:Acyltransferase family protein n=1 Tax=Flagellimonas olearia TaxID=552546 RepID=A0A6I1DZL1_9FLAO|nr:acyltransferase [Allomuricauda olearia]KAB7530287.1 acyltransferase family protein [Allomuricauda olearia]
MKHTNYIDTLTPLRGIAAIWVVLYHYDQLTSFTGLDYLVSRDTTMLLAKGYLFVDFFFLLSGFILTHVYGNRFQQGINIKSSWNYLWARFSRLYPLHLFCLLTHIWVACFLIFGFPNVWGKFSHMYALKGIPVHLFLTQAWGSDHWLTWNVPSWSISAEWAIYMVSPLLFLFLFQKRGWWPWIMALFSFTLLGTIVHFNVKHSLDATFDWGIFRCLAEFTLGILVYNLYQEGSLKKWLSKDLSFMAMVLITLFGLHIKIHDVWIIPCFILIILTAAHNQGKVQKTMKWPLAQYLGEISYSIYMMQGLWLSLYWMGLDSWLVDRPGTVPDTLTLFSLVMSLLFVNIVSAAWSYHNVEIPFQQKLRKIKFKRLINFQ